MILLLLFEAGASDFCMMLAIILFNSTGFEATAWLMLTPLIVNPTKNIETEHVGAFAPVLALI